MSAMLDVRRANDTPKCANCGWWSERRDGISAAECGFHKMRTLDLAVCTAHTSAEVAQRIEIEGK